MSTRGSKRSGPARPVVPPILDLSGPRAIPSRRPTAQCCSSNVRAPCVRALLLHDSNLYRDVIEPARDATGIAFTVYDARDTFVSTLMAAGVPVPEVANYSGHSSASSPPLPSVMGGCARRRRSLAIVDDRLHIAWPVAAVGRQLLTALPIAHAGHCGRQPALRRAAGGGRRGARLSVAERPPRGHARGRRRAPVAGAALGRRATVGRRLPRVAGLARCTDAVPAHEIAVVAAAPELARDHRRRRSAWISGRCRRRGDHLRFKRRLRWTRSVAMMPA